MVLYLRKKCLLPLELNKYRSNFRRGNYFEEFDPKKKLLRLIATFTYATR